MIDLMNEVRYFLPHLLALSTSSPFWMGRDTGLKSYRTTIFRRFPRTGVPDHFGSWSDYENYVRLLVDLHCIDDGKKIWWDVRPHPTFGTLEFRVCDVPTRPEVAVMLGALIQAVVVKLCRLRRAQSGVPALPARADRGEQVAGRALGARRQADRLRQARGSADAGSRDRAARVRGRRGGRPRQPLGGRVRAHRPAAKAPAPIASSRSYRQTGDLKAVVRDIVEQTKPDATGGMQR